MTINESILKARMCDAYISLSAVRAAEVEGSRRLSVP